MPNFKIKDKASYLSTLNAWARSMRSDSESEWNGPGVYQGDSYYDDRNRPVATLKKVG